MVPGDCWLIAFDGYQTLHLWILVAGPTVEGLGLIVSVTTLRNNADQTVILQRGCHEFIRHQSCVYYADALVVATTKITQWQAVGLAIPKQRLSAELLAEVQEGLSVSDYTPQKAVAFFNRWKAAGA